ncbi:MAG TPA: hypothetical protein PL033_13155 [Candidatus Brocadiia bacterium]|nr:hypothetical protein [Candidatus Brocadiia bacterium]
MLNILALLLAASSVPLGGSEVNFLFPEELNDSRGIKIEPQQAEPGLTLLERDEKRPKLWFAPVASTEEKDGVRLWYQRVNNDETEWIDKRTLCVGKSSGQEFELLPLRVEPPAWGGINNVCMTRSPHTPTWGGFNVFQIIRVADGFRMLYWDQPEAAGQAGAMTAYSGDGLGWTKDPGAVFTEHNDAFTLIECGGEYICYQTMLKDWPDKPCADNLPGKRRVQTVRLSKNLRTWTPQVPLLDPDAQDAPDVEFYLMKAFRYGGAYAGLLMKYYADPEAPGKHSAICKYELIASRDAKKWSRPFRDTDLGFWSYADPFMLRGRLHFAIWKEGGMVTVSYKPGRLAAISDVGGDGEFTIPRMGQRPKTIILDADTENGQLEMEAFEIESGRKVESFRIGGVNGRLSCLLEESEYRADRMLGVRFRLRNAKLYSVRFTD